MRAPFEESGLSDVGDAPVNNRAGVQDLGIALPAPLSGKEPPQSGQVEQVALAGANHQTDIGHQQQHRQLEEIARVSVRQSIAQHQRE